MSLKLLKFVTILTALITVFFITVSLVFIYQNSGWEGVLRMALHMSIGGFIGGFVLPRVIRFFSRKQALREVERVEKEMLEVQRRKTQEPEDKMLLNASIFNLIETQGTDEEAAQRIIAYAVHLPLMPRGAYYRRGGKSDKENISGYTNEFGTVNIKEDQNTQQAFESNLPFGRVGQFKLWRNIDRVFMQPFMEAEPSTCSDLLELVDCYMILFEPIRLFPVAFCKVQRQLTHQSPGKIQYDDTAVVLTEPGKGGKIPVASWIVKYSQK